MPDIIETKLVLDSKDFMKDMKEMDKYLKGEQVEFNKLNIAATKLQQNIKDIVKELKAMPNMQAQITQLNSLNTSVSQIANNFKQANREITTTRTNLQSLGTINLGDVNRLSTILNGVKNTNLINISNLNQAERQLKDIRTLLQGMPQVPSASAPLPGVPAASGSVAPPIPIPVAGPGVAPGAAAGTGGMPGLRAGFQVYAGTQMLDASVTAIKEGIATAANWEKMMTDFQNGYKKTDAEALKYFKDLKEGFGSQGITGDANVYADTLGRIEGNWGLVGKAATDATGLVLGVARNTKFDTAEMFKATDGMIKNLGVTGPQAAAIINDLYAKYGDKAGDLLDTFSEYSVKFKDGKLNVQTFYKAIAAGAEAGNFNFDKGLDSLKEFSIKLLETKPTDEYLTALNKLGINWEKLKTEYNKGGQAAEDVLITVSEKIIALNSTAEGQNVVSKLFGSPGEDTGLEFFKKISQVKVDMDEVYTSAEKTRNKINQEFDTAVNSMTNTWEETKVFMGEQLIPILEVLVVKIKDLNEWFNELDPTVKNVILVSTGLIAVIGPLWLGISGLVAIIGTIGASTILWTAGIGLAIIAITALVGWLTTLNGTTNKYDKSVKDNILTETENLKSKQDLTDQVDIMIGRYQELADKTVLNSDESKELKELQDKLIEVFPDLAGKVDGTADSYDNLAAAARGANDEQRKLMLDDATRTRIRAEGQIALASGQQKSEAKTNKEAIAEIIKLTEYEKKIKSGATITAKDVQDMLGKDISYYNPEGDMGSSAGFSGEISGGLSSEQLQGMVLQDIESRKAAAQQIEKQTQKSSDELRKAEKDLEIAVKQLKVIEEANTKVYGPEETPQGKYNRLKREREAKAKAEQDVKDAKTAKEKAEREAREKAERDAREGKIAGANRLAADEAAAKAQAAKDATQAEKDKAAAEKLAAEKIKARQDYFKNLIASEKGMQAQMIKVDLDNAQKKWDIMGETKKRYQDEIDTYAYIKYVYKLTTEEMLDYTKKQYDAANKMREVALKTLKTTIDKEVKLETDKNDKLIELEVGKQAKINDELNKRSIDNLKEDTQKNIDKIQKEYDNYKGAKSGAGIAKAKELKAQLDTALIEQERTTKQLELEAQKKTSEEKVKELEKANTDAKDKYETLYNELTDVVDDREKFLAKTRENATTEANKNVKKALDQMVKDYKKAYSEMNEATLSPEQIQNNNINVAGRNWNEGNLTGDANMMQQASNAAGLARQTGGTIANGGVGKDQLWGMNGSTDYQAFVKNGSDWQALEKQKEGASPERVNEILQQQKNLHDANNALRSKYGVTDGGSIPMTPIFDYGGISQGNYLSVLKKGEMTLTNSMQEGLWKFINSVSKFGLGDIVSASNASSSTVINNNAPVVGVMNISNEVDATQAVNNINQAVQYRNRSGGVK